MLTRFSFFYQAFSDQNLTKRLGLPVIPLSCLFIRASLQTYHMFLATNVPMPIPSPSTSLSVEAMTSTASPATTAALQHIDTIIRRALGRSSFGAGGNNDPSTSSSSTSSLTSSSLSMWTSWIRIRHWTVDDVIAFATMLIFFLGVYLILLAFKLVLGMLLLAFARSRYRGMKEREKEDMGTGGRRTGGWGVVEVDDDKRRWIYQDDPDGARASRERERAAMMRDVDPRKGETDIGIGDGRGTGTGTGARYGKEVATGGGGGAAPGRTGEGREEEEEEEEGSNEREEGSRRRNKTEKEKGGDPFAGISRYTMVAKRIW